MNEKINLNNDDYNNFVVDIKKKIRDSQYEAMKEVNKALIKYYILYQIN